MKILLNQTQKLFSTESVISCNKGNNPETSVAAKNKNWDVWRKNLFPALLVIYFLMNMLSATAQLQHGCCKLVCRDTTVCFTVPDSAIHLAKPKYKCDPSAGGGTGGNPPDCIYDSIWNNSPGIFPVGTTVVTWYVHNPLPPPGGSIDSCTQNVIRNPPSIYSICFTTSPPVIGGVINVCNGTPITFNANCSIGISGVLWNFGNGFYSGNPVHTEPAWF